MRNMGSTFIYGKRWGGNQEHKKIKIEKKMVGDYMMSNLNIEKSK